MNCPDGYAFQAVYKKTASITSAAEVRTVITNSDETVCPTTWSIVKSDGSALDPSADSVLYNLIKVNAGNFIEIDQTYYDGTEIDL